MHSHWDGHERRRNQSLEEVRALQVPWEANHNETQPERDGRRFGRLDLAVVGAKDIRCQLEHDGWTGISPLLSLHHGHRRE